MWDLNHIEGWVLKNWCFHILLLEKTLESPWTIRRSNQSIPKEISPEYSLEGLMLKVMLWRFGYLMPSAHSLEKTLLLGKTEGKTSRGQLRMQWLDGISDWKDKRSRKLWDTVKDRERSWCSSHLTRWAKNILEGLRRGEEKAREEGPAERLWWWREAQEFSSLWSPSPNPPPRPPPASPAGPFAPRAAWLAWLAGLPGLRGQVGALSSEHALCWVLDPILLYPSVPWRERWSITWPWGFRTRLSRRFVHVQPHSLSQEPSHWSFVLVFKGGSWQESHRLQGPSAEDRSSQKKVEQPKISWLNERKWMT